jgi:hypothetical protein
MSVEAVDKFHEGKHNINSAAGELRELSELFYHVGNEKISKQLNSLSEYLENDVKLMDEAFCDLLLDRVNSTEKMGQTLLEATLAGIQLARKNSEESTT